MMYIKMMSAENLPDTAATKRFMLLTIGDKDKVDFKLQEYVDGSPSTPVMVITDEDGGTFSYDMDGNVYIMNQNGKTIAHYSPNAYIYSPPLSPYHTGTGSSQEV